MFMMICYYIAVVFAAVREADACFGFPGTINTSCKHGKSPRGFL